MHKIDLISLSSALPTAEKVATVGFFDGVHAGHRHIIGRLRQAAQAHSATSLVVSFVRHPLIQIRPEAAPMQLSTSDEKLELLRELGVDECALLHFDADFSQLSARGFMSEILRKRLGVTQLLVGYDHRFGRPQAGEGLSDYIAYGRELGVTVVGIDECAECRVSSSIVREHLERGFVEEAAQLLRRPYGLSGVVVRGFQNGQKIGFPTANLMLNSDRKIIPAEGVYATRALVEGQWYAAMTNIGTRPTVSDEGQLTIETHLLDFEGSLYEKPLTLHFVARLRSEQRFESLEALSAQLRADALSARAALAQ